jgi:hypothetical protein
MLLVSALATGALGCVRAEPELRLAVAEAVESGDLESGSTLVVRGEGFPVGAPAEVTLVCERRSYLHPGSLDVTLPARAVSHDRVEVALDAAAMTTLLGAGDDDARLAGSLEVRFHTTGAVVTTAPIVVQLRARAFPRNELVAAEKRARVEESLRAAGVTLGDGLVVVASKPTMLTRGDVREGDRLTALDGVPLATLDDAIPPRPVGVMHVATTSAEGAEHQAKAFLGVQWVVRMAACVAAVLAAVALLRRVRPVAARAMPRMTSEPPARSALVATASAALGFELLARFLRVRLDAPVVLVLASIVLFGPSRRALTLALAFGLAASAALVGGGVFRVDELHGALSPLALPGLLLVLAVWGQRFGGGMPTRAAYTGLLFALLPAVHVFAPRIGVLPSLGRAAVATALVILALPSLQRGAAPLRDSVSGASLALALGGSFAALAVSIAVGPLAGAITASVACALLVVGAAVGASAARST